MTRQAADLGLADGLLAAGILGYRALRRPQAGAANSIPYAPAIALGVWLSLVPKS